MSNSEIIPLIPRYFLDEELKNREKAEELPEGISSSARIHLSREFWTAPAYDKKREEKKPEYKEELKKWVNWIKSIRIEIAEESQTKKIKIKDDDKKYDYLRSEIGMNIIVPQGRIAKMRFKVSLHAKHRVVAMDGFPKDVIDQQHIVQGQISVAISKYFKFIPMIPPGVLDPLDIVLGPWDFKLGSLNKVNIDFSGGLTSTPEWYFKEDGIKNDLRITMTIRKPKNVKSIEGKVKAGWIYSPGFLRKAKVGTSAKSIKIL